MNGGTAMDDDQTEKPGPMCPRSSCLQLFLDGELEPTRASDLEAHLADCEPCAERASLLRAMKSSVRRQCGARVSDTLRAKICLAVARESSLRESGGRELAVRDTTGREIEGVEAALVAASPSRESLSGDRARRAAASHSPRVAYGVGALALAAGVALAVVGERSASWTSSGDGSEDTTARNGRNDGPNDPRTGDPRTGDPRTGDSRMAEHEASRGVVLPREVGAGVALPGSLIPVGPSPTLVGNPSLAPSAIAGRPFENRPTFDAVLDDLVAEHMNPPVQMDEMNPNKLVRFESAVGVAMRAPIMRKYDARFRGARIVRMHGAQRTAMLSYELPGGERVAVYLWNPQAVPIGSTRLHPRAAGADPIYVGEARGYSIAACERRGIGYALATKRDTDESVRMVTASLP